MFVRLKKVKNYTYLQIVENRREGKKTRQRVIATLGRLEELREKGRIEGLIESLRKYTDRVEVIRK